MSFEFLTKELGIPVEKLSVTVFAGDEDCPRDEVAAEAWKKAGILDGHIYYYGKDDNWWIAGEEGPCGPDTEMFYDTGNQHVQQIVNLHVTVENMLKFGIMYLWNTISQKMVLFLN